MYLHVCMYVGIVHAHMGRVHMAALALFDFLCVVVWLTPWAGQDYSHKQQSNDWPTTYLNAHLPYVYVRKHVCVSGSWLAGSWGPWARCRWQV